VTDLDKRLAQALGAWRRSLGTLFAEHSPDPAVRELAAAWDAYVKASLPDTLETNMPTEEWEPRAWSRVPAGWFIRDPKGCAWEVLATESDGRYQRVTLRNSDWQEGTWPRKPGEEVEACPGTAAPEIQGAVEALASRFVVDVISDQVS
jgi:hypothetical protein